EPPYRPLDAQVIPRFAGIRTFMRAPHVTDLRGVDAAVYGIPFDTATTYRSGPRFGPEAIRSASALIRPYHPVHDVNVVEKLSIVDYGDLPVSPGDIERTYRQVEEALAPIVDAGIFPAAMGGDHSVTLAELPVLATKHGSLALVQLDAHADTWDEYFGQKYFHGTTFKRAADEGRLAADASVQAGKPILVEGRRYADSAGVMSHQAYGPLVGVPRIIGLLAEYELPATFFVPGLTAERYPQAVEQILAAGHEVGHHSYAHFSPFDQDEAAECADFERALAVLDRFDVKPEGFRCPSWEPQWRTPALVAEHGLAYDSSLMDADTPYLLETSAGDIVELPVHWSLDDWEQYAYLPRPSFKSPIESPQKVLDLWISEL